MTAPRVTLLFEDGQSVPRPADLRRLAAQVARGEKLQGAVDIAFCGDATVRALNKRHRKLDKVTDVLSFEWNEPDFAGEIYIEHTRELSEEDATTAGVAAVVAQLLDSKQSTVLCTHRPVLPWVFDALALEPAALEPGSIAVIHHRRRRVICVEVHSAPSGR